jgi:putrescine transport system substrate-binding protein
VANGEPREKAKNGVNVSYFIPKRALAFFDVFAMPADAKNKTKRISSLTT